MPTLWYYGRGSDVSGPVSGKELSDLATSGQVIPTDTIWRDDIETGVPAAKVKNLFPVPGLSVATESPAGAQTSVPLDGVPATPSQAEATVDPSETPPEAPTATAAFVPPAAAPAPPARAARASAGKGAIIVSQDGKTVKYRGKCTTCGREDTSWRSIPIPRGMARASFYCAKCRKRRDIEINGYH